MKTKTKKPFGEIFLGVVLVGMISGLYFLLGNSSLAAAQEGWTETPAFTETPTETPVPVSSDYYSVNPLTLSDGTVVQELIIHGPPVPPPGYEIQRQSVTVSDILTATGTNILTVPAFPWVFGCSAVSGAMIAGYYDRNGYSNIYTGPTDGGVMPIINNPTWGSWVDVPPSPYGNFTYFNNPLVASKLGLDGRVIRGSIDDYWVQYGSTAPDPYITNGWTQHPWGEAIGDYMRTSQSHFNGSTTYGLNDAYTRFYGGSTAAPLQCSYMENNYLPAGYPPDGTLGRKQFYEAKGYAVTDCYNQNTDNQYAGGFSFIQYKSEIDAGRPVMINLEGHTIVGVGYADPSTVYIHNTWDNQTHSMTWGGSYSGMAMVAVSIVNLAPSNYSMLHVVKSGNGNGTVTSSPVGINCGTSCTYGFDKTTSVILTAAADTGNTFTGWSGAGCSGTGTCTVFMSSAQSVTATFSLPDLMITRLAITPSAPFTNDNINVSVDVSNIGIVDATTFRIEYYVDDVWKSCWYLGTPPEYFSRVASLAAGSSGTWSNTIPAGALPAGPHTISAYLDMGCEVAEGNETNNSAGPTSVTIAIPYPGSFTLTSPTDAAVNQPTNPTLQWGTSIDTASYEYCINTTSSCVAPAAWTSVGTSTSVAISGRTPGATYYWQVRARNTTGLTYANGGSVTTGWFSFTVLPLPGSFIKSGPANGSIGQPNNPTLSWAISTNAVSYSYCIDTTNDNSCNTSWISTSTNTSVALSGLTPSSTYYWQVSATNANGTTNANASTWWSFGVGKTAQTITITSSAPVGAVVGGPTYTPTATATSGLVVAFTIDASASTVCTISAGVVSFIGNGTCIVNANQAGNATYNPAPQVQQSFGVGKADQTITFTSTAPTNAVAGGATYTPTATATSGLTVTFTIDASASTVCTISTGVVSFIGTGTCTVNANQAGNGNYNPAPQVQQSFAVSTTFGDVPVDYTVMLGTTPYNLHGYIQRLYMEGFTAGCQAVPLNYCPNDTMLRAHSAVFMLRGLVGTGYTPPSPPYTTFVDPSDLWADPLWTWSQSWAQGMWDEGLTAGCGVSPLRFCPWRDFSRVEAAVFGLHISHNDMFYTPPAATGTVFADMTDTGFWGAPWAEQAYAEGLIPACITTPTVNFCPDVPMTRAWAAYVIVKAKGLTPTVP